jgi:hypothetical protein
MIAPQTAYQLEPIPNPWGQCCNNKKPSEFAWWHQMKFYNPSIFVSIHIDPIFILHVSIFFFKDNKIKKKLESIQIIEELVPTYWPQEL